MATVHIRTRIDRKLKKESDAVLREIGLDINSYVSLALKQLVNRRGLPFTAMESDESYFANEYGLSTTDFAKAGEVMKSETARALLTGELREVVSADNLDS